MLDVTKIYKTRNYGDFKVIEYTNQANVLVEFIATGYRATVNTASIRLGTIKDKLKPSVYGVGFVGSGKYSPSVKCKETKAYIVWKGMFNRCYSQKSKSKYPSYKNCTVDNEWHNFQNFAEWYEFNYIEGYHLDKDTLQRGVKNKVYSKSTCVFITQRANSIEAKSLTKKLERAIKTLQCIADNPEWNDHHCRAKKCIEDIS